MAVPALAVAYFMNEVGAEYGLLSQANYDLCVLSAAPQRTCGRTLRSVCVMGLLRNDPNMLSTRSSNFPTLPWNTVAIVLWPLL